MNISDAFTPKRLNCDSDENSKHLKWVKELVGSTKGPCENQAANLRSYRFLKAWNNAKSARRTNEANRPNKRQKNDVEREWHSKQKHSLGHKREERKKSFVHARFAISCFERFHSWPTEYNGSPFMDQACDASGYKFLVLSVVVFSCPTRETRREIKECRRNCARNGGICQTTNEH